MNRTNRMKEQRAAAACPRGRLFPIRPDNAPVKRSAFFVDLRTARRKVQYQ